MERNKKSKRKVKKSKQKVEVLSQKRSWKFSWKQDRTEFYNTNVWKFKIRFLLLPM